MSGFDSLPSELIAYIASFLDPSDVFAARLTSRRIERSSFSLFGTRFFRKKGYLVTSPSLHVLAQVAKHEELRKYVRHIWFHSDCFTDVHPDCDPTTPDGWPRQTSSDDRKRYKAFLECKDDHDQQFRYVKLQAFLKDAFATLPNLTVLGIQQGQDCSPWGWKQLREAVGEDPRILCLSPWVQSHSIIAARILFITLLNAVAVTEVRLVRFYANEIEIDNISAELLTQNTLDKACGSLQYLRMNVTRAWHNRLFSSSRVSRNVEACGNGLLRLLRATTELNDVTLQVSDQSVSLGQREIRDRRKGYPYNCLGNVIPEIHLTRLERIKLEKVTISRTTLLGLLTPCGARLASLKIRDVSLLAFPDRDPPLFPTPTEDLYKRRPWYSVFSFLRDDCPRLEYLLLHSIGYVSRVGSHIKNETIAFEREAKEATSPELACPVNTNPRATRQILQIRGNDLIRQRLEQLVEHYWLVPPSQIGKEQDLSDGGWHTDGTDEES